MVENNAKFMTQQMGTNGYQSPVQISITASPILVSIQLNRRLTLSGEQAECTDTIDSNWTNLSVALKGYIYAIGGIGAGANGSTERYDPKTDNWTRLGNLGFPFRYGAVAVLGGQIWACGGFGHNRGHQCHILDTSNNSWVPAATMKEDRSVIVNPKSPRAHFITLSIVA